MLDLGKWFAAIWMVANCKNGIGSYEMHRPLGVTRKTAWFMDDRIRLAMKTESFIKMRGEVEADETFVGGLAKNMHKRNRAKKTKGTGASGKAAILGIIEQTSEEASSRIKAAQIPNVRHPTLQAAIREAVEPGSHLHTDALAPISGMSDAYDHETIDHAVAFVDGNVHANNVENFWSLLKRSLKGTHVSVEPFHLGRYGDEQAFRFNEREDSDAGRFRKVLSSVAGRRLTYDELIGHASTGSSPP